MTYPIRQAQAKLCEIGATLSIADVEASTVFVMTETTTQIFDHAIAKLYGPWVLIWTAYDGYHLHHRDHIVRFRMFTSGVNIEDLQECK